MRYYFILDIIFGKFQFSISVFDKPKDLKIKIAEISNEPKYKRNIYRIRVVDKESYIYGDEILIDFEPVYNSLIRGLPLHVKCTQKSNVEKKNIFVRFWAHDKNHTFWREQILRNQMLSVKPTELNCIFSNAYTERFEISLDSYKHIYSVLKLLMKNDNYKTLKKDMFYQYKDQGTSNIIESLNKTKEEILLTMCQMPDEDLKTLKDFNKCFKSTTEFLFIVIEISVYDGTKLIGRPEFCPINLLENSKDLKSEIHRQCSIRFLGNIKYSDLTLESRLAINVWCVNTSNKCFLLGSAGMTIFNFDGYIKQGNHEAYLWPLQKFRDDLICYGSNRIKQKESRACVTITFKKHDKPLKHKQNK